MTGSSLGLPGVFGKHPSRGDFLASGNRAPEFTSLDAFLTHNIEWAEAQGRPDWVQAYNSGSVQAFVHRANPQRGGTALVGVLAPSWDRAGRRFPLTVGVPLRASTALSASPEVLPIVLESCWQAASDLLLSFTSEISARVEVGHEPLCDPELDLGNACEGYASWTRTMPSRELWGLIFGEGSPVDPVRVLSVVGRAIATCRGVEAPTTSLALRLPLGAAGGAALCFWLDLVSRVARWKATIPSFFWSHNGQEGSAVIALGNHPVCTLSEVWDPTGQRDPICDVATAPWHLMPLDSAEPMVQALAQLHEQATIAEVLHAAHCAAY